MNELVVTNTDIKPDKVDGRTKNGKRIDIMQVIKLRDVNGLSYGQIGKHLGYSVPHISRVYRKFKELLPSTEILTTYNDNRTSLLSGIELKLLEQLHKDDKLKDASLNNVAYTIGQVSSLRRLESGQSTANIGIKIEGRLAKALEKSRGDSVSSKDAPNLTA
jgi:hypothetical protein